MPIYAFQCGDCQTVFDVRASFKDKELGLKPACPKCKGLKTHQVITAGMFVHTGGRVGESVIRSSCGPNTGSGCCG